MQKLLYKLCNVFGRINRDVFPSSVIQKVNWFYLENIDGVLSLNYPRSPIKRLSIGNKTHLFIDFHVLNSTPEKGKCKKGPVPIDIRNEGSSNIYECGFGYSQSFLIM